MPEQKKRSALLITAIILGILGLAGSIFAYTVVFSFLSIFGLILALVNRKKSPTLGNIAIGINIIAVLRLIYIIILINSRGIS